MKIRPIPWLDYASRLLSCALLFATGFALLSTSTFALRMRNDVPLHIAGLTGPQSIALVISAALSVIPLLAGPAFLGALLVCGWLMSGMGAYWWTTIAWDNLIHESDFTSNVPPTFLNYALVAGPAVIATLHVVLARVSRLRRDCKARGVDPDEARVAAAASFLSGAGTLLVALALSATLWALLATGALTRLHGLPVGIPALLLCAAVVCAAWAIATRRVKLGKLGFRVKAEKGAPLAKPKKALG